MTLIRCFNSVDSRDQQSMLQVATWHNVAPADLPYTLKIGASLPPLITPFEHNVNRAFTVTEWPYKGLESVNKVFLKNYS